MSNNYSSLQILSAIAAGGRELAARKEEINRLNVFPIPDGDTGTNMSLTINSVIDSIAQTPKNSTFAAYRKAITTGALMGARGNSGVITSQILRGICEGVEGFDSLDTQCLDKAFSRAKEIAFKAVRKPVQGTILTVLEDCAKAAAKANKDKLDIDSALEYLVKEAYLSVERSPELLAVLKENGVVDAGGFGLAIFFDGFVCALTGKGGVKAETFEFATAPGFAVAIEQVDDWEGSEFMYCTEFLVYSETLDASEALDYLGGLGDCELVVGSIPNFKVHVHTNTPDVVLKYMLERGQISEVHIHNMLLQSKQRSTEINTSTANEPPKEVGFVAVASGSGNASILKSLGVDVVISGGQTMNPSTKDLLDAVNQANANNVVILPNNSNIILAAKSCASVSETNCYVVETKSIPQAFSAMIAFDADSTIEENIEVMTEDISRVKTGEITTAVKKSKDSKKRAIKAGDIIGICNGSVDEVGDSISAVTINLLKDMNADEADSMTLLAGEDFSDTELDALISLVSENFSDLEIDFHRGEQPLYPVIFSLE